MFAAVICSPENLIFYDIAKALCLSFQELGHKTMCLQERSPIRDYASQIDLAIIMTPFEYFDIRQMLPKSMIVLYQLEVMPWTHLVHPAKQKWYKWPQLKDLLSNYDVIFDYDRGNMRYFWQKIGQDIRVVHLPVGYSSIFELTESIKSTNEVLFVGCVYDKKWMKHRTRVLKLLNDNGIVVRHIQNIYGDAIIRHMKGAAVNLNIHSTDMPVFESPRIIQYLFSNKAFVISETCNPTNEFVDSIHWRTVVSYGDMPNVIKYFLEKPQERINMAQNAYEFVKKNYTMTQNLKKALELGLK
jgi:hypothetical protein